MPASSLDILGLVPARGGSKGIPRKNIRPLAGKPLIGYTLEAARQSRMLTRLIVSTDDTEIADVAQSFGAEAPFLRPSELASDGAPTVAVVRHALEFLSARQTLPDVVVLLQPTAPLRQARHIDQALAMLISSGRDAVVSVAPSPSHCHPRWQFVIRDHQLCTFTGEPLSEIVTRRQALTPTYTRNGAIYAFHRRAFEETGSLYGRSCAAYLMPEEASINLDTMDDWRRAEAAVAERHSSAA